MKKSSVLKLMTVVVMIALILGTAKMSFAATQIQPIENSGGNSAGNNTLNSVNNTTNNVANNTIPVNNTNKVENTTLPEAGKESSLGIVVLIALTSISAIYTYIKVKEYNI
jgi:uncharacterized protein HemX